MKIKDLVGRPWIVLAGLMMLTFILYFQILQAPFVYDDHELLLDNPLIKDLSSPFWDWQSAGTKLITLLTFAVNYRWGGQHPFGYHLVNVILHALNSWFLYLLVRMFFKTPRLQNTITAVDVMAVIAAAIFLCHPIQTHSVSYIWQRSELLNALFYFLTLLCYMRGRLHEGKGFYVLSALFFVLGFYSKGMIVSFPLLALMLEDALFDVPRDKRVFLRSAGVGIIIIQLLFWHNPWLDQFRSYLFNGMVVVSGSILTPSHFYTQLDVLARYIILTIFPFWQNLDHTVTLVATFWNIRVITGTVVILFLLAFGVELWKRQRLLAVGIYWFLIVLLPSSLLGGRDLMVEHRLYFAIAGYALFGAVLMCHWVAQKRKFILVVCLLIGGLSGLTLFRNHLWQSPRLLLEDTVRKSPQLSRPAVMLGMVYLQENRLEEAVEMFVRAIKFNPNSAESYNNLGIIYLQYGQSMQAEQLFNQAISVRPDFAPAYINLGYFALRIGDIDRAEKLFRQAGALGRTGSALVGLGNIALSTGSARKARMFFQEACEADPHNEVACRSLAK